MFVRAFDRYNFTNADEETDLHIGTAAGAPYTDGNTLKEGVYSDTFGEISSEKSIMEIVFHCDAGTDTWTYESQYR